MIERHVIEIRKEMSEKRSQDDEKRKQYVIPITSLMIKYKF